MASGLHQIPDSRVQNWAKRSHAEYMEGESLVKMIHGDLIAGRISIDGYRDIIRYLRAQGAPTRRPLEAILAIKGQRAGDAKNRAAQTAVVRVGADPDGGNT